MRVELEEEEEEEEEKESRRGEEAEEDVMLPWELVELATAERVVSPSLSDEDEDDNLNSSYSKVPKKEGETLFVDELRFVCLLFSCVFLICSGWRRALW